MGAGVPTPSVSARDLVVIRQHTDIVAVAATQRSVFALSTRGLVVYDRIFQQWCTPDARIVEDLAAAGVNDVRIRAIAADPVEDAVWLAVPGAVVIYRVAAAQVQRLAVVGQPDAIRFARGDAADAYVRSAGRWLRVSRAGFVSELTTGLANIAFLPDAQLTDVYQRYPALRGQLPLLLRDRDDRGSSVAFARIAVAAFSAEQPSELYVGTLGDGLWSFNADFFTAAPMRYGLLDEVIGALAAGANGVWAAGQGQSFRGGLSFVAQDAQQFAWRVTDMGSTLRGLMVRDLVVRGPDAWAATDQGVRVLSVRGEANMRELTTLNGLPHNDVSSVLPLSEAAWIGTRGGLGFVRVALPDSLGNRTTESLTSSVLSNVVEVAALRGVPVNALARNESVLLVGTQRGVFTLNAGSPTATASVTPFQADNQSIQLPIRAVATSDSMALVVTDENAFLLPLADGITDGTTRVPPATRGAAQSSIAPDDRRFQNRTDIRVIGRVVAAALDDRSVWVAGERGVMAWGRDGAAPKLLRVGQEVPDLISDMLLDGPVVWIGTRQGLVRVPRARDGGLP